MFAPRKKSESPEKSFQKTIRKLTSRKHSTSSSSSDSSTTALNRKEYSIMKKTPSSSSLLRRNSSPASSSSLGITHPPNNRSSRSRYAFPSSAVSYYPSKSSPPASSPQLSSLNSLSHQLELAGSERSWKNDKASIIEEGDLEEGDQTTVSTELSSNNHGRNHSFLQHRWSAKRHMSSTAENALRVEEKRRENHFRDAFAAWVAVYKAFSFQRLTVLQKSFRMLHNICISHKEVGVDVAFESNVDDQGGDAGSLISDVTFGHCEESVNDFEANVFQEYNNIDRRVSGHRKQRTETINTPRASILNRHRVANPAHRSNDKATKKIVPGNGAGRLSSLWREYEKQLYDEEYGEDLTNKGETISVESDDISCETAESKSSIDTSCLLKEATFRNKRKCYDARKKQVIGENLSDSESEIGIISRKPFYAQNEVGGYCHSSISNALINHGAILPSRSPPPARCESNALSPLKSCCDSNTKEVMTPQIGSSSIKPETLRSLSSIKVKTQTSSSKRNANRQSASFSKLEKSSKGGVTSIEHTISCKEKQHDSSYHSPRPPPPPPSSLLPPAIAAVSLQKHHQTLSTKLKSMSRVTRQGCNTPSSVLSSPGDSMQRNQGYTIAQAFHEWHQKSRDNSNVRLMADDHFFKRHVFGVFDFLRQRIWMKQKLLEGSSYFIQKSIRLWVQRVLYAKEQQQLFELVDGYFDHRRLQICLIKFRTYSYIQDQANQVLLNAFSRQLHDTLHTWRENIHQESKSNLARRAQLKPVRIKKAPQQADQNIVTISLLKRQFKKWRRHFIAKCNSLECNERAMSHFAAFKLLACFGCFHRAIAASHASNMHQMAAENFHFNAQTLKFFNCLRNLVKKRNKQMKQQSHGGLKGSPRRLSIQKQVKGKPQAKPVLESVPESEGMNHFMKIPKRNASVNKNHLDRHYRNMSIFSRCFVSENNQKDLKELFEEIDTDSSGTIDFVELYNATKKSFPELHMEVEDVQDMMRKADLNDDGVIDFDEFCIIMKEAKNHVRTKIAATKRKFRETIQGFVKNAAETPKSIEKKRNARCKPGVASLHAADQNTELRNLFDEIDTDESGTIEFEELYRATRSSFPELSLSYEDVHGMMVNADLNNDGVIDYDEFCIVMKNAKTISRNENEGFDDELRSLFDSIDSDKSGTIEFEELYNSTQRMFPGLHLSFENVQDMMNKADLNDDGVIDFEEFCFVMRNVKGQSAQSGGDLKRKRDQAIRSNKLRILFDKIDTDRSGTIDTQELRDAIQSSTSEVVTDNDMKDLMMKADLNNDGVIDFEEFCIVMDHANSRAKTNGGCFLTVRWLLKWKAFAFNQYEQLTIQNECEKYHDERSMRQCLVNWRKYSRRKASTVRSGSQGRRESLSYSWYKEKTRRRMSHISSMEKSKPTWNSPEDGDNKQTDQDSTPKGKVRGKRLSMLFQRLTNSQSFDEDDDVSSPILQNDGDEFGKLAIHHWMQPAEEFDQIGAFESSSPWPDDDRRSSIEIDAVENVVHMRSNRNLVRAMFRTWNNWFQAKIHYENSKKYSVIQHFFRLSVSSTVMSKLHDVALAMFKENSTRRALKHWYVICQLKKEMNCKPDYENEVPVVFSLEQLMDSPQSCSSNKTALKAHNSTNSDATSYLEQANYAKPSHEVKPPTHRQRNGLPPKHPAMRRESFI